MSLTYLLTYYKRGNAFKRYGIDGYHKNNNNKLLEHIFVFSFLVLFILCVLFLLIGYEIILNTFYCRYLYNYIYIYIYINVCVCVCVYIQYMIKT